MRSCQSENGILWAIIQGNPGKGFNCIFNWFPPPPFDQYPGSIIMQYVLLQPFLINILVQAYDSLGQKVLLQAQIISTYKRTV